MLFSGSAQRYYNQVLAFANKFSLHFAKRRLSFYVKANTCILIKSLHEPQPEIM